jgi:outer membrane protein TolC
MNNLMMPVTFTQVRSETRSLGCAVIRFVLGFSSALFLISIPGYAQTPASDQKTITLEELQQMALQNNPTFTQASANIRAAEGREQQSGLYPNPTVGYQGEQIRGGSFRSGEQGFFIQQSIVTAGKLRLNRNIFNQEK